MRYFLNKKNQSGFTLVEVLASIAILSVILLGVLSLFTTTNQMATSNNNRLVAINLGKATLERVKADTGSYFNVENLLNDNQNSKTFEFADCESERCKSLYQIKINDKDYRVSLRVEKEEDLKLLDVLVEVELEDQNIKHQVEGYVSYVTKTE